MTQFAWTLKQQLVEFHPNLRSQQPLDPIGAGFLIKQQMWASIIQSHNCCSSSAPTQPASAPAEQVQTGTDSEQKQAEKHKNKAETYMSKFLHAVLHGSLFPPTWFLLLPSFLFYFPPHTHLPWMWADDGATGRRPTGWCEPDARGEVPKPGSPYRQGLLLCVKVRHGLPPIPNQTRT